MAFYTSIFVAGASANHACETFADASTARDELSKIDGKCREKVVDISSSYREPGAVMVCDPGQWVEAVDGRTVAVCRCGERPDPRARGEDP
ncbi:MAG TPA: hypothetical protein VHG09_02870 [Longimicrobiales bacterium]|nr:hypothetical protein [Longimicrobiales bacterium]